MSSAAEVQELADTVRAVLGKYGDRTALRQVLAGDLGYDSTLWQVLCEQVGVAALAIPEEYGGIGAGLLESFTVVEELGRTLHAPPMLGSAVLGVQALLATGDADACARLLPEVAAGTRTLAVGWAGASGWDTPGVGVEGGTLTGTAHYVLDGIGADTLLVVTEQGLYEIDSTATEITRTTPHVMDPTRRLTEITFTAAPARAVGDGTDLAPRLRQIAWLALAAEQLGAADECLWATVEYTGSRVQFGRPIGSFQALKHRMADMYLLVESARSLVYTAIAAFVDDEPDAGLDVAAARLYTSEAFTHVVAEMVQLHGGIAITWEHDAHLYFKRAHGDATLFGTPARPLARPA